jgi:hypothetical protein|tara:strand:+ start:35 stop:1009 length:975 start_codon:yes stop_codon:yes gene_type:complete
MATYKETKGTGVRNFSSDPANPLVGQVWYNTTSSSLKYFAVLSAAWATGGNLGTGRNYLAGCGTQTAGLSFGGSGPSAVTEEYDGSAWTAGGALGTARARLAGAGTQTVALGFGGGNPTSPFSTTATEEYDGSAWTGGGSLGTARRLLAGAGTQTAGLAFGGILAPLPTPGANISDATEEYDGSSWTAGGNLGTARYQLAGAGTQTAGLAFGGRVYNPNQNTGATEEYDGSTWTAGGAMINARRWLAGAGTQTAGLAIGGAGGASALTEEYDGTSWAATTNMNSARGYLAGAGTQTLALAIGGSPAETEEFTGGGPATLTVGTD